MNCCVKGGKTDTFCLAGSQQLSVFLDVNFVSVRRELGLTHDNTKLTSRVKAVLTDACLFFTAPSLSPKVFFIVQSALVRIFRTFFLC